MAVIQSFFAIRPGLWIKPVFGVLLMASILFLPYRLCAGGMEDDLDFSDLLEKDVPHRDAGVARAWPEYYRFEGELRPSLWYPLHTSHDIKSVNRLDLLLESHHWDVTLAARLRADYQSTKAEEDVRADIRELYLQKHLSVSNTASLSFAAGRKILYWGKGDEIRPVDRVSPEDMTHFLFYDKNDRKTGIPGLFLNAAFQGGIFVETFWSPLFVASEIPDPGSYFGPPRLENFSAAGGEIQMSDEDWTWQKDASLGIRLGFPLYGADASLYAWRGKDPMPQLKVSEVIRAVPSDDPPYYREIPPTAAALSWFHENAAIVGGDIEFAAGPYVFRGETAWQFEGNQALVQFEKDPDLLDRFPSGIQETQKVSLLLGVDRNNLFFRNLFANFQYVVVCIPDHEDYLEADPFAQGFSATLEYTAFDSRLRAFWRVFAWMESRDQQHQVMLSWRPARSAVLRLGAFFYEGGTDKDFFGQFRDRDFVYLQASVLF